MNSRTLKWLHFLPRAELLAALGDDGAVDRIVACLEDESRALRRMEML